MKKRRWVFTGACLVLFLILTYFVSTGQELAFDTVIREWFYSLRTPWLTEVVKAITFMGNTKTVVTICVLLLVVPLVVGAIEKITKKDCGSCSNAGLTAAKKIGLPIAVVAIVGSAINKTIKHLMMRPRPDVSLHLIEQGGWSFPSGHSISALLLYGFLAWLILRYVNKGQGENSIFANSTPEGHRKFANILAVILTVLWICVGLSRIYLGVHYPTDVLGGWTLGMMVMMVTIALIEKIENRQ